MTIKIDLANQVRQTVLPQWKPLLPLFEAVMNSFQAIRDAKLPATIPGRVTIATIRRPGLFADESPPIDGFEITDNGIGLDDDNFDSFNTAFSRRKVLTGGKGLGRFTWLKAFEGARIDSVFADRMSNGALLSRSFIFDENYTLDRPGLPMPVLTGVHGTTVQLFNLKNAYTKMLRDAKNRNRIFFEKLNLINNH
jgi:hypothetical protein